MWVSFAAAERRETVALQMILCLIIP